jgi:hypothetical protein
MQIRSRSAFTILTWVPSILRGTKDGSIYSVVEGCESLRSLVCIHVYLTEEMAYTFHNNHASIAKFTDIRLNEKEGRSRASAGES